MPVSTGFDGEDQLKVRTGIAAARPADAVETPESFYRIFSKS